jgi:hypothetical protein
MLLLLQKNRIFAQNLTMRSVLLFFIYLNALVVLSAQDVLKGTLLDANSAPIPYANVGVLNTAIGTVSRENGEFELFVEQVKAGDTIKISAIGFESRAFTLGNFRQVLSQEPRLRLETTQYNLAEITVVPLNTEELGFERTDTDRNVNFAISSYPRQNLGAEIARKFKLSKYLKRSKNKACRLDQFKFFLRYCDYDWAKLRVMVYELNGGQPAEPILTDNLIVEVKKGQKGWIEVNLKPYNLVAKTDIAIGVEWIDHSPNGKRLSLPIAFPAVGSTHFYQFGSQNAWKKFPNMSTPMLLKVAY